MAETPDREARLEEIRKHLAWGYTVDEDDVRWLLSEIARLRARQREEGDVDTRTIGLALNDIRSIVRQDWTWTTELQRHYDLAMDALRPEPPYGR